MIENMTIWLRLIVGWVGIGLMGVGISLYWQKRKQGKIKAIYFKVLVYVFLYCIVLAIANTITIAIEAGFLPLVDYRVIVVLLIGCSIGDNQLTKRALYLGAREQNPVGSWMIKKFGYNICQLLAILMMLGVGKFILSNPDHLFIGYTLLFIYLIILASNTRFLLILKRKRARALIVVKD